MTDNWKCLRFLVLCNSLIMGIWDFEPTLEQEKSVHEMDNAIAHRWHKRDHFSFCKDSLQRFNRITDMSSSFCHCERNMDTLLQAWGQKTKQLFDCRESAPKKRKIVPSSYTHCALRSSKNGLRKLLAKSWNY